MKESQVSFRKDLNSLQKVWLLIFLPHFPQRPMVFDQVNIKAEETFKIYYILTL